MWLLQLIRSTDWFAVRPTNYKVAASVPSACYLQSEAVDSAGLVSFFFYFPNGDWLPQKLYSIYEIKLDSPVIIMYFKI